MHTLCAHRRRHWVNTTAAVWAGGLVQSGRQGKHQMQCAAWKCSECSGWCLPRGGKSDWWQVVWLGKRQATKKMADR